jgi:hypothetical protein
MSGNSRTSAVSGSAIIYGVEEVLPNNKKVKKMGWLKRKLAQWAREDREESLVSTRNSDTPSPKSSIRFSVYPASGGWVIEHSKQDRYKNTDGNTLTIITNFDDLGKTVEHIITLESLRS